MSTMMTPVTGMEGQLVEHPVSISATPGQKNLSMSTAFTPVSTGASKEVQMDSLSTAVSRVYPLDPQRRFIRQVLPSSASSSAPISLSPWTKKLQAYTVKQAQLLSSLTSSSVQSTIVDPTDVRYEHLRQWMSDHPKESRQLSSFYAHYINLKKRCNATDPNSTHHEVDSDSEDQVVALNQLLESTDQWLLEQSLRYPMWKTMDEFFQSETNPDRHTQTEIERFLRILFENQWLIQSQST